MISILGSNWVLAAILVGFLVGLIPVGWFKLREFLSRCSW